MPSHALEPQGGADAEPHRHLFELLVGQLSEADVQSHCSGASPSIDRRGAYVESLSQAAARIEELVRELDATTTLLIASDHGTVDAGGSGGSEPTSVDVPLIAYRAGSQLGLSAASGVPNPPLGVRRTDGWRTVDVAPTIAALLGVPAPRQSEGMPIEPLLPLANQPTLDRTRKDVFVERQRLASKLASSLGVSLSRREAGLLAQEPPPTDELKAATEAVVAAHAAILARANRMDSRLSSLITGASSALLLLLLLAMLQRSSFADLRLAYQPTPGQYANRRAFVFALVGVTAFYAASIGAFLLLLRLRGYSSWDSTVLHFPTELVVYLLDVSLPSLLAAYVLYRTMHFPYLVTPGDELSASVEETERRGDGAGSGGKRGAGRRAKGGARGGHGDDDYYDESSAYSHSDDDDRETLPSRRLSYGKGGDRRRGGEGGEADEEVYFFRNLSSVCARSAGVLTEYVRCLCLGHEPVYSDLAMIYLLKVYTLLLATATLLTLAVVQSRAYTFLLPQLLLVRFDVEADWTNRFQLLTLQLMTLSLMFVSTLSMLSWPAEDLAAAYYDKLYSLVLLKFERRRGATAKSDDVLAMLDEETEALVRARYQAPFARDD